MKVELRKSNSTYDLQSDVESTFAYTSGGEKKVKEIIDPNGAALVTDWLYYDYDGTFQGGKLQSMTRYDGYEETYSYTLAGTVQAGTAVETETKESNYAGTAKGLKEVVVRDSAAGTTTTTRSVGTQTISKTVEILGGNVVTSRTYVDANNNLETKTEYNPVGPFGRQVKIVTHADGTVTCYEYDRPEGTGTKTTTTYQGVPKVPVPAGPGAVPILEGTKTVTVINAQGELTSEIQTVVGTGNGTVLSHSIGIIPEDAYGRPASIGYFPNGSGGYAYETSKTYSCCGVATETDQNGVTTTYAYDDLKRRVKTNRLGVTTATVYDGLTVSTHRFPEAAADAALPDLSAALASNCIAKSFTNAAGTISESWSPDPSNTSSTADGALVKTTTATTYSTTGTTTITNIGGTIVLNGTSAPTITGGDTQYSYTHPDGRAWKTNGALAPATESAYAADNGQVVTTSYLDGTTPKETTTTHTDLAGRTVSTAKGSMITNYFYYGPVGTGVPSGSGGKLHATIDADGVTTLYAYNSLGERETTARKLDAAATITYGTDQITRTKTFPNDGKLRTTSEVWQDGATEGQPTLVAYTDRTPTGLASSSWQIGRGTTHTTTTLGKARTETTTNPDGTRNETTYANWFPDTVAQYAKEATTPIATTTYGYELPATGIPGRPITTTDSRTGTTTTAYISKTCDAVLSVTPPAGVSQRTLFTYDSRGNRTQVNAPDTPKVGGGDLANETTTTYDSYGRVETITGATYPVTYTYDYTGRMKTMKTTGNAGDPTTTWLYDSATGLLLSKRYDSNSDGITGTGPDYTYTPAGRPWTRKWVRLIDPDDNTSPRVLTTYGYTNGLLTTVTYNDGTPDVTYNYDAFPADNHHLPGTLETVTRAGQTWTYRYDSTTYRLLSETSPLGGTSLTRTLTRDVGAYGRPGGFTLGTSNDPDADHSVAYGYDNAGRQDAVTGSGKSFTYGYTYTQANGGPRTGFTTGPNLKGDFIPYTLASPVHTVTRTYEATRDALTALENKVAAPSISAYSYVVNDLGQRNSLATGGSAFGNADYGWTWGYDSLGQLTTAANATDSSLNRGYSYDTIGNRLTATDGSDETATTTTYTPNSLNQHQQINPGTAVNPTSDPDGNLRSDAGINTLGSGNSLKFGWDAENRLTTVTKATNNALLVAYVYDFMGRRIRRTSTTAAAGGAADTAYLYDGWNVAAEYTLTNSGGTATLLQAYTWGLDLSGTLQGAGGVGGLLCIHRGPGTDGTTAANRTWSAVFYPTFDGNGNISEYLDKDGTQVAHFEYDPFGRVTRSTGTIELFAYRFSTKPLDPATGWFYYGYRWYDPLTGRWPSRDPIEEEGGVNLYGFVGNNGVDKIDELGLNAYAVYRPFKSGWQKYIYPVVGHVFLAFDDKFDKPKDQKIWNEFIQNFSDERNSQLITMSFHPLSVKGERYPNAHLAKNNGNIVGIIDTSGSYGWIDDGTDKKAFGNDKWYQPGTKTIVTADVCKQIELFKIAYKSMKLNIQGIPDPGVYQLLHTNCGTWVKTVVERAHLSYPFAATVTYNTGATYGGPADFTGLPRLITYVARTFTLLAEKAAASK